MAEVTINYELIQKAAQHPDVRARVEATARKIAGRVESLAHDEEVDMAVTVVSGTRPGGRPFSNVVADNVDQEFGTGKSARYRIVGRAAEEAK